MGSGSAGVTEEVDFRGGILFLLFSFLWVGLCIRGCVFVFYIRGVSRARRAEVRLRGTDAKILEMRWRVRSVD